MEPTCRTCNHWESQAPVVKEVKSPSNFGACNELSNSGMKFILPVVQHTAESDAQIITGADFGCNHYAGEVNA